MSINEATGRVYRSSIKVLVGQTRGKRPEANGTDKLGHKEVEFKLDIGKRRLPSPDVKKATEQKERAPEFVIKPRRQFVDEGQNAKFKVSFEGSISTQLFWSKDGKRLDNKSKFKMSEKAGYHYLEVCDVTSKDSGVYVATVQNSAGKDTASAELDVFEKPKLLTRGPPPLTLASSLKDLDVVIGDRDVKLKCQVTGGEDCTVTWYHNGQEVRAGRRYRCRYSGQVASLAFTEIGEEDGGMYECVIANSSGEVKTACTLSTQEGEKFEPPVFIKELQDIEVEDGDKVELIVEVKGTQPIHVYWNHNNCLVTVDTPGCVLRAVDGVHSLIVPRASAQNAGEYVCEAYNDYGDTDTFCRLRVQEVVDHPEPPEFISRPKIVTVQEGSPATFNCRVKGHPPPAVWWERDGCKLCSNENHKISSEGDRHSLQVVTPHKAEAGYYICHVHNKAGSVTHTCSLVVNPVPTTNTTTTNVAAAAGPSASGHYRALLKPSRQHVGQIGQQSSTESERSDKENEVRGFRNLLRNNRQTTPSPSTSTTTITTTLTTTTSSSSSSSRFTRDVKPKTPTNGDSTYSALPSSAAGANGKAGGVRKNLELFEKRSTPSPERPALPRQSASPVDKTWDCPAPERQRSAPAVQERLKPSAPFQERSRQTAEQEPGKPSPLQERTRQTPVEEIVVTKSRFQQSHATPAFSKDRFGKDSSPVASHTDSSKSQLRTESPKTDFRSVLSNKQRNFEKNGTSQVSAQPSANSKPSWARKDPSTDAKTKGLNRDLKTVPSSETDFRNVLKNRKADSDSKSTTPSKETKASVQSKNNFKTVLAKLKSGSEDKKNGLSGTGGTKPSSERTLSKALSKDVNSIKSKFEAPAKDFRSVQLKPSKPLTTDQSSGVSTNADSTRKVADWRTKARDTVTPKTTITDYSSSIKQPDVSSTLGYTSRYSEAPKHSDSSQLSDSAISSAFSKLSEFSDFSDDSSPRSSGVSLPVEVTEPRSRRRLERLRGEGGGNGGTKKVEDPSEAPSIQQRLKNQKVTYGGQAVFQCRISGVPEPDINWSVNSKLIKPSKFFQLSFKKEIAQLVVAEAFSEDEGEYTCVATNAAGTDSCSCYLTVEASSSRSSRSGSHAFEGPVSIPPRVQTLTPGNLTVRRGQPACFQVTFTGEPAPAVRWFQAKTELTSGAHFKIMSDAESSSLSISAASANDGGRYTVTITNDLGTDLQSANLSVEDVPEPPVGQPHVYDLSRRSMSLSWCGPAYDGGSVVTHYVIEVRDSSSQRWTTLVSDCQSTSYTALNLTADSSYEFRVRAANKLGLSDPSLASDPVAMMDHLQTSEDYESDDELPFEPREVTMTPGRKFEDHYEYLNEVGKGKFGSVYKCRDKVSGKIWAAKVLKVREKDKANVRQEVAIMNKLAHPKLLMLWDAFEAQRTMVLIIEYVGAGELFERVIRDDFVLTERDCVHFVRQICSGVGYMHSQSILHLDLKPENVLCVADNSNQIKIIDFGLARFYKPGDSLQVLFGTPEFIAPEVINYDAISFATDLWSIGVICYILLSGLSPFLGDTDAETLANVTSGDYDFDDESFEDISDNAKDFISQLLVKRKEKRNTIATCEQHSWLAQEDHRTHCKRLNTDRLRCFMARRKWQKTGNAIRALGRMASLQKLLTGGSSVSSGGSLSSIPDTPSSLAQSAGSSGLAAAVNAPLDKLTDPFSSPSNSSAAHKVVEDTGKAAAATAGSDSPQAKGGDRTAAERDKNSSKLEPGRTAVTTTSTTAATTAQPSPSSRRRAWEEKKSAETDSNARLRPTTAETVKAESADIADGAKDSSFSAAAQDSVLSSTSRLPRADITTNTDTKRNGFSPSQAPRQHNGGGDNNNSNNDNNNSKKNSLTPPSFLKEMVDCTVFSGDVVRFDVKVTGQPAPQLVWTLEEEEVEEDDRHIVELGENGLCSLIVRNVSEDDEGEYSCKAVNTQGDATCSAELSVYGLGVI